MRFKKAVKYGSKALVSVIGHSGAGKTYTALTLATALAEAEGKRIAVICTEYGAASKYAHLFDFDVLELEAPYSPQNYIEAIHEAEQEERYGVILVDSLSHEWFGPGGVLEMVDELVSKSKNHDVRDAWRVATPQHNRLLYVLGACSKHLLCTMRAKTEIVIEKDAQGKATSRKITIAAIQRDGIEFEFDVSCEMEAGLLTVINTRYAELNQASFYHPGEAFAHALLACLAGEPAPEVMRRSLIGQILSLREAVGEPAPNEAIEKAADEQLFKERDRLKAKRAANSH